MSVARLPVETPAGTLPRAVVYGCAGSSLTAEERAFFREADPLGFILFRRNCRTPEQVRALVADMRAAVGRVDAPVLIDQEGGRVARLKPPHWPAHPAARRIGALAEHNREAGREAAWLNARILAAELSALGIDVDCAPVCDVLAPDGHDVIGDRAFSADPELVAELARASCAGFQAGGVLPVIKHLPGHGRALVDSHKELPVVTASRAALDAVDFIPFCSLADLPLGMVAHVVYHALDPEHAASISAHVMTEIIRGALGFSGFLFSDDISMEALHGAMGCRTRAVLAAGCDAVLHCNGNRAEMEAIAAEAPPLTRAAWQRWTAARHWTARHGITASTPATDIPAPDLTALRQRLTELLDNRHTPRGTG